MARDLVQRRVNVENGAPCDFVEVFQGLRHHLFVRLQQAEFSNSPVFSRYGLYEPPALIQDLQLVHAPVALLKSIATPVSPSIA